MASNLYLFITDSQFINILSWIIQELLGDGEGVQDLCVQGRGATNVP